MRSRALITASATLYPFSLACSAAWWAERSRWYLHRCQDRGKHATRFLIEKPLRRRGSVSSREEKVVHSRQGGPLSGVVKPAKLVISQREISVAPFHICTGALEHLRELGRLSREGMLRRRAQRSQRSIRRKQRSAETLSKRTKRLAFPHRLRRGHTVEIACGNEMGMDGVGRRRR